MYLIDYLSYNFKTNENCIIQLPIYDAFPSFTLWLFSLTFIFIRHLFSVWHLLRFHCQFSLSQERFSNYYNLIFIYPCCRRNTVLKNSALQQFFQNLFISKAPGTPAMLSILFYYYIFQGLRFSMVLGQQLVQRNTKDRIKLQLRLTQRPLNVRLFLQYKK